MVQHFIIVDVSKRVAMLGVWRYGETCFGRECEDIIPYITRPVPTKLPIAPYSPSATGLFKLPYEVLEMIFHHIHHPLDLVVFLITNRTLCAIGFNYVHQRMCNITSWCLGDRLLCLGEHCQDNGLPEGLLPRDLEAADAWKKKQEGDSSQSTYADFMKHTFHAMHPTYLSELIGDKRLQKNPRRTYSEDLNTALTDVLTMNYPPELEWILCNITKRVCVTAKGITERTGVSPRWGPFFKAPVNFALILMLKITWSTDDNLSMNYQGGIHQGPWACDRFEITTMDRLDQVKPVHDGVKTDWKDVSKEVMEEIVEIAKAEIGVEYERIVFSRFKRPLRRWNERWFVNMEDD